jgi:DNA polymerase III epsilon subunit-like protein
MIVVDIETSGLDFQKCGIWQIGAIDLTNPKNEFLEEARIDDEDKLINEGEKTVQEIIGKTEEDLRDKTKQSQKSLLIHFFEWSKSIEIKNCLCQNPQFDLGFMYTKARKYDLNIPFHHRAFDLHSIAHTKYFQINKQFLIKDGKSDLGLKNTLEFVGMKDNRGAHNALEDAKLEAECFSRIIYGRNLLPEFKEFPVPECLRK